jgi:hypothetical protein
MSFKFRKESRPKIAETIPTFEVFWCIDEPQRSENYTRTDAPFLKRSSGHCFRERLVWESPKL